MNCASDSVSSIIKTSHLYERKPNPHMQNFPPVAHYSSYETLQPSIFDPLPEKKKPREMSSGLEDQFALTARDTLIMGRLDEGKLQSELMESSTTNLQRTKAAEDFSLSVFHSDSYQKLLKHEQDMQMKETIRNFESELFEPKER